MRLDDVVSHDALSESEPHLFPLSRRRRKRIILATSVSIIIATIVAVAISLTTSSINDNNGAASPSTEHDAFMDVIDQTVIRQHPSSTKYLNRIKNNNNNCLHNEGSWTLKLKTDNYPYEIKWELYDTSTQQTLLAFGPPTNTNYNKLTNYIGNLCLPIGE